VTEDRIALIRARLEAVFEPQTLEIVDDSHKHAGHAGARGGLGHFSVRIVSARFVGTNLIERHRMVYDALGSMMTTDIHALHVVALVPD
jgi:BolA protein